MLAYKQCCGQNQNVKTKTTRLKTKTVFSDFKTKQQCRRTCKNIKTLIDSVLTIEIRKALVSIA